MTTQSIHRAVVVLALGAMAFIATQTASAQTGAMQSSGATGSSAADSRRSRSSAAPSNATGDAAAGRLKEATSPWRAGTDNFGFTNSSAFQMKPYSAAGNGTMWSPGIDSFAPAVQPEGMWIAPAALATEINETGPEAASAKLPESQSPPATGLSARQSPGKVTPSGVRPTVKVAAVHGGYSAPHLSFGHTAGRPRSLAASSHRPAGSTSRGAAASRGLALNSIDMQPTQNGLGDESDALNRELHPNGLQKAPATRHSGSKKQRKSAGTGAGHGLTGAMP